MPPSPVPLIDPFGRYGDDLFRRRLGHRAPDLLERLLQLDLGRLLEAAQGR